MKLTACMHMAGRSPFYSRLHNDVGEDDDVVGDGNDPSYSAWSLRLE